MIHLPSLADALLLYAALPGAACHAAGVALTRLLTSSERPNS